MAKIKELWLQVSLDQYELPTMVADSSAELAKMTKTKKKYIEKCVWLTETGRTKRGRYVRVRYD